jgi:hypothetical protein
MNDFVAELMRKDDLIPVIAIIGGLCVGAIWIIFGTVQAMVVGTAREKTKRELAAYVASGSLDPDKAIAMINAGKNDSACA